MNKPVTTSNLFDAINNLKDGESMSFTLNNSSVILDNTSNHKVIKAITQKSKKSAGKLRVRPVAASTMGLLNQVIHSPKTAENSQKPSQKVVEILENTTDYNKNLQKFLEQNAPEVDENGDTLIIQFEFSPEEFESDFEADFSKFANISDDSEDFQDLLMTVFLAKSGYGKINFENIADKKLANFVKEMLENWDEIFNEKSVEFILAQNS